MGTRQVDTLLQPQGRGRICRPEDVNHGGLRQHGLHLRPRRRLDDLEPSRAHRMVVRKSRTTRRDDVAARPVDPGKLRDPLGIAQCRCTGGTDEKRARTAGCDQRGRRADEFGDTPPGGVEEVRQVHEPGRGRDHRGDDLGCHAAAAIDRPRTAAIDEAAHPQRVERIGVGTTTHHRSVAHTHLHAAPAGQARPPPPVHSA